MNKKLNIAFLYLLIAFVMRFFSFFPYVLDHDESTYLVIADMLLKGNVYWVDVIDTKPPGIFLIYALLISVAGKSIFLIRLLVAVWIALTASGIYCIARHWIKGDIGPFMAGICYIVMTSVFTFLGVSPNTELFFTGFTVFALLLLVIRPWHWWPMIFAGLLLGAGLAIKQVVVFDAVAIGVFLLSTIWVEKVQIQKRMLMLFVLTIAAFIPTVMIAGWYYFHGIGDTWFFYQFTAASRYPSEKTIWQMLKFTGDFLLRYLPVTALSMIALYQWRTFRSSQFIFLIFWSLCILAAIIIPGNSYYHYFIQMMPPVCLLAGWALDQRSIYFPKLSNIFRHFRGWLLLIVIILLSAFFQYKDYYYKVDRRKLALEYIRESGVQNPTIYTGDVAYQILYFLLDAAPPVKYPHPSLLWNEKHINNLDINQSVELQKVMDIRPDFCLMDMSRPHGNFDTFLSEHYIALDTLQSSVVLFKARPE